MFQSGSHTFKNLQSDSLTSRSTALLFPQMHPQLGAVTGLSYPSIQPFGWYHQTFCMFACSYYLFGSPEFLLVREAHLLVHVTRLILSVSSRPMGRIRLRLSTIKIDRVSSVTRAPVSLSPNFNHSVNYQLTQRLGRRRVVNPPAPFVVRASPIRGTRLRRVFDRHWRVDQSGYPAMCVPPFWR